MEDFWKGLVSQKHILTYVIKFLIVATVYIVFLGITNSLQKKVFSRIRHLNRTIQEDPAVGFVLSGIKILLNVIFILLVLPIFGVKTTSITAFLGALGLGIGLGLQNIATDIFSGIKLLTVKPFHVGDQILYNGGAGEVQAMNITYTILKGEDASTTIYVPNRLLTASIITNLSRDGVKLLEVRFPIGPRITISRVKQLLIPYLKKYVAKGKEDSCKVQIGALQKDSSTVICSFLCPNSENSREVTTDILEFIRKILSDDGNQEVQAS